MNYTKEQEKAINDYLAVCIKNNYHCQHCANNHNGVCFFAFQCFADDMGHFDDGDDIFEFENSDPCEYCEAGECHHCYNDDDNYDPQI